MRELSIGTAVFSLLVYGLTVIPGPNSTMTVDDNRIPEGRGGQLFRKIQQSYTLVHGDSLVSSLVSGRSYDALETYLGEAKQTLKRLRNFKKAPSQADKRADIDFSGDAAACGADLLDAIRRGERDRWGRLTPKGGEQGLPPCSAESRREAIAHSMEKTVENAAFMANQYRRDARVFRVEFRLAAGLGMVAAACGLFGWSTAFFLFLLGAGLLPFGYRALAAGRAFVSFLVLPLYAVAAVGSLYLDTNDE